jgi:hypothetical protein
VPSARNDDPRLRSGIYGSSGITSAYAVSAWTVASDQKQNGVIVAPWIGPYQMIPPRRARVTIAADGTAREDGFYSGIFGPFDYWTFGQMSYFTSTYLSGGVLSALVSMMVWDENDSALYLNATIYRPIINSQFRDMEPAPGGWQNIGIRYGFGEIAA